jgi:hypothetical protein
MSEIQIPEASLVRLRAAYQQFEILAGVVAEALGIDPREVQHVNVQKGVFVVPEEAVAEPANGAVHAG